MQSRTITYIRHAKKISNRQLDSGIIYPRTVPIYNFDYIVTSPFLRCRQTASVLNPENKPVFVDTRISEYLSRHISGDMNDTSLSYGPIPSHLGETYEQFTVRVNDHWDTINNSSGNVLVVTHGLVVLHMQRLITGRAEWARGRLVPNMGGFTFSI